MPTSKQNKLDIIRSFLEWADNYEPYLLGQISKDELLTLYADTLTECDSAIAHGPGHQSTSRCIVTGPHSEHCSDMGHEWKDADTQTYTQKRFIGPDYTEYEETILRLAFEQWYS